MNQKGVKILLSVMIILGALINIVPELISSIVCVCLILGGLFLAYKFGLSKPVAITSVVLNVFSILVCGFCLLVQIIYKGTSFKLGLLPMGVTCIVSIILTIVVIVFTFITLKKSSN